MSKSVETLLAEARTRLHRVTPRRAAQALAAGALLVDLRPIDQRRAQGVIPGAVVIGRNEMEWRLDPTSAWRHPAVTSHDQDVILFCAEGYQSSLAAALLLDMGFATATDMAGGFLRWKAAGLPTEAYDEA